MRKGLYKGILLNISPESHLHLIYRNVEPHLQQILRKYINKGDTVFDIGANIGYVSTAMSKLVGEEGKVFAFEAIPMTAAAFTKNIKLNNCTNIQLIQKALADTVGKVIFRIPNGGKNHSMASMMWYKSEKDTINVSADTIAIDQDNKLKQITPSFIKIDVEGSEGLVVKGMQELIAKSSPVIFIECSKAGRNLVWEIMKKLNYSCFLAYDLSNEITDFDKYIHNDFMWLPN